MTDSELFLRVVVSLAVSSGVTSLVQYRGHACLNVKKPGTFALDWSIIAVEETNWIGNEISVMNSDTIFKSGKSLGQGVCSYIYSEQTPQAAPHRLQTYQRKVVVRFASELIFSTCGSSTCTPRLKSSKMQWKTSAVKILLWDFDAKIGSQSKEPLDGTAAMRNATITVND